MNKVKNDSQPYVLYVFAIISLIVIDFIIGIFFIHNLSRFIDNLFKFNFNKDWRKKRITTELNNLI